MCMFASKISAALCRARLVCVVLLAAFFLPQTAMAETIDWLTPAATDTNIRTSGVTHTMTYGTSNETTAITSGAFSGTFAAGPILAVQPTGTANGTTGFINSTMDVSNGNGTMFQTVTINFNEPVYNLSVVVGDIDGGPSFIASGFFFNDIVEFRGTSPTNATVLPTSGTPVDSTKVAWDSATGRASAQNFNVTDNTGDVNVTFAGPIKTLTIRHIAGANSNGTNTTAQFTYIETVTFTRSPRVTLRKTSVGGTGAFPFAVTNVLDKTTTTWAGSTISQTLTTTTAGTQVTGNITPLFATNTATTLTETPPTGWQVSAATCTGATPSVSGNAVTLPAGAIVAGAVIVCDITNSLRPRLTLVKTVTNNNGGTAAVSAFTLTATGSLVTITGASGAATVTNAFVNIGNYALSETGPSGYLAAWACPSATMPTTTSVSLTAGQNITCTVNNDDIGPRLTLVKTIVGDVTPSAVPSFSLTAAGPVTINGTTGAATVTNVTVSAGNYALSETGPATGYIFGSWTCDAGTFVSGSTWTFALGQVATCTVTNTRRPTVAVNKITPTTAGGPFTFTGTNLTTTIGNITTPGLVEFPTATAATRIVATTTGSPVQITEGATTGYVATNVTCTDQNAAVSGNTNPVATSLHNIVDIPGTAIRVGADIVCTYTNSNVAPSMSIAKTYTFTTDNGTIGRANVGDVIRYKYVIQNTGNVRINNVAVSDVHEGAALVVPPNAETIAAADGGTEGPLAPTYVSSDATANNGTWSVLQPGARVVFYYNHTVTQTEFDNQ
jgi:hypothetical protein